MSTTDFSNARVWFVTGSSQGLGRALVEELLNLNERVVATLRKPEALSSLASKYPSSQLLLVQLDVADHAQIKAAFQKTKDHFGRLDVVVNNAGYGVMAEIEVTPEDIARHQFEVMYWGPFHITREAIPFMRDVNPKGLGGRILNISSAGGYSGNETLSVYNSAKFALEGLTEAFVKEMDPSWNITGVIIEPGGFRTEWAGSSMIAIPPPPAYAHSDSPTVEFRNMVQAGNGIGDPSKAAKALVKVADMPNPPLRIQLGTDSLLLVKMKAGKTLESAEKYAELSHSTNADGVDKDMVIKMFETALK